MKDLTKNTQLFYISIIFPAIIVLVIVYFLIPIDPGGKGSSLPKTPQMKKLAVKIGRLETEVHEKQKELFNLLKEYSQKTGETPPVLKGLGLSDDERKILEDKLIKEEDLSIKSLLRDILDRDNEILRLKSEIAKYEALLPKSHIAAEGESHYQIAMDFLIKEKKVEKERAYRLVEETILFDPLKPGFRVWNFYSNDEFATFVTQGNAAISPFELREAPAEAERLIAQINKLRSIKVQIESQIDDLRDETEAIIEKLLELNKRNTAMQTELNSLFYMVDLEENLLKRGIIKSRFLGLGSPKLKIISREDYNHSIDLRMDITIEIYARKFNLSKIKKVTLHPGFYKRDIDYKVKFEEDNQKAVLKILTIEKFRNERVVISVE